MGSCGSGGREGLLLTRRSCQQMNSQNNKEEAVLCEWVQFKAGNLSLTGGFTFLVHSSFKTFIICHIRNAGLVYVLGAESVMHWFLCWELLYSTRGGMLAARGRHAVHLEVSSVLYALLPSHHQTFISLLILSSPAHWLSHVSLHLGPWASLTAAGFSCLCQNYISALKHHGISYLI